MTTNYVHDQAQQLKSQVRDANDTILRLTTQRVLLVNQTHGDERKLGRIGNLDETIEALLDAAKTSTVVTLGIKILGNSLLRQASSTPGSKFFGIMENDVAINEGPQRADFEPSAN